MKCLMVRQPWASQIADGSKTVEIRSWHYAHRGDLLIGASKNMAGQRMRDGTPYPSGMAIAHVKLVDCVPFNANRHGKAAGCDRNTAQDCEDSGDWAWILADARAIEPFPVKGQVKPFEVDYPPREEKKIPLNPPFSKGEARKHAVLPPSFAKGGVGGGFSSRIAPTNLVNVTYAQTSASINTNRQGMRDMQARAFAARDAQYLLLKAPPASGKSRALMFLGLDKLYNQGVKKVIVAVPERAIGGSFSSTKLTEHGFFADWEFSDAYNLCTPGGESSKVNAFQRFLDDSAATILICTHATLRFAFEGLETSRLNDTLLAIDEFHHVSADVDNRLGEVLRTIMNTTNAHIIAMTGSYFRGDSVPVLQPDDEARFTKVTYNYYEQLNGYTHLKTLGIGYHFYQGRYLTAIGDILDTDKKTILHIPNVNAGESTKDKRQEVDRILDIIGRVTHQDAATGVIFVERADGKIIKVADLVNDNPKDRDKIVAYLRNMTAAEDMDLIIALGMAKEGFDWPFCEHALTVGYRGSLTEIIQIIGRATRDSEGKPHAQFTNLIAQPDAADAQVKLSVNNMLKAITASLLMEQVLAPNFTFKTKRFDDEEDTPPGTIKIRGFKEPSSKRVKDIVESDLNDLKAAILQDSTILRVLPGEFIEPEVINKVLIPKVIRLKYPDLTDEQVEEVRQHVVADSAIKNGEIKTVGDKQFVRMAGKFVNIEELHIDLIDRINPFQKAFEVLSKSVTSKLLKVIQETIDAGRIAMTDEEAVILYRDKIGVFLKTHGREPAINAPDPLEKRMAEALVYLRNKRRQQQAATPATEMPA